MWSPPDPWVVNDPWRQSAPTSGAPGPSAAAKAAAPPPGLAGGSYRGGATSGPVGPPLGAPPNVAPGGQVAGGPAEQMQQTMLLVADRIGQALTAIADGAKSQRQQGWDLSSR